MPRTLIIASLAIGATLLAILGLGSHSSAQAPTAATSNEPVLVELFTSQGCSSCPPADRLAERMAREKGLVIISRPVDYWDRLGWKDTLASPENTALQRAYARRGLGGYNGVYTPQTVVAGALGEVGSNERTLRAQIRSARRLADTAQLRALALGDGGFSVNLKGPAGQRGELVLMGVSSHEEIAIKRGENRGRTIRYTNALIDEMRIADWDGGRRSVAIRKDQLNMAGADRYALVLRETFGGRVLAAAWLT